MRRVKMHTGKSIFVMAMAEMVKDDEREQMVNCWKELPRGFLRRDGSSMEH
jgi:hypothetical protein